MSDLVLAETRALVHRPEIRLQFACVPDGGIPIFERTWPEWEQPEDQPPVWVVEEDWWKGSHWRPRFASQKVFVSMVDLCPYADLKPHEYRMWNEHVILRLVRNLRGSGVLTISHRRGWPWHFGLSWSRYPLRPVFTGMTRQLPTWWGAEDWWAELDDDFDEFQDRLEYRQHLRNLEWDRREALHRRRIEEGIIPRPRPLTEQDRERFRRQIEEALADALRDRPGDYEGPIFPAPRNRNLLPAGGR